MKLFWKDKANNLTRPIRNLMNAIDSVSAEWRPLARPDKKVI